MKATGRKGEGREAIGREGGRRKKKAGRSKGEVGRECKDKKKTRNLIFLECGRSL